MRYIAVDARAITLADVRRAFAAEEEADAEETLDALGPLWSWLQENRRGMLQADGEGYYDVNGLVLEVE